MILAITLLRVNGSCSFGTDSASRFPLVENILKELSMESVTIERFCIVQSILITRRACSMEHRYESVRRMSYTRTHRSH